MRRTVVTLVLLGLVIGLGLFTRSVMPPAQGSSLLVEAAPNADHTPIFLESLGSTLTTEVPNKRLQLMRLTLAPGASMFAHTHPGELVVAIESGTLAYTVLSGDGASVRGAIGIPIAEEVIPPGAEAIFGPGEFLVEPPGVAHSYRNPGEEPVVLLISALTGFDVFFQPVETPVATPAA
ncbi:MAG TPA: cupin domain-containing protein [Thermomicrobiales bacterium]|nr:cupin domain-containing protein [Thermomicrobiales bacterium]